MSALQELCSFLLSFVSYSIITHIILGTTRFSCAQVINIVVCAATGVCTCHLPSNTCQKIWQIQTCAAQLNQVKIQKLQKSKACQKILQRYATQGYTKSGKKCNLGKLHALTQFMETTLTASDLRAVPFEKGPETWNSLWMDRPNWKLCW